MKIRQVILIKMYENNHNAMQQDISAFKGEKNRGVQTEKGPLEKALSGMEPEEFWVGKLHSVSGGKQSERTQRDREGGTC